MARWADPLAHTHISLARFCLSEVDKPVVHSSDAIGQTINVKVVWNVVHVLLL